MTGVVLNALAQLGLKMATRDDRRHRRQLARHVARGPAARRERQRSGWRLPPTASPWSVWFVGLSRLPVSQAYPVLSLGYIIAALLAWMVLGETISLARWAGIGLIIAGVMLVSGSQ